MTDPIERLNPWERLGTEVSGAGSALEAMEQAGLAGWNIRKVPIQGIDTEHGRGRKIDIPQGVGIVRDDPATGKPVSMAVTGPNYHIIQNEDLAGLIDKIASHSGAVFDTAGEMSEGRKVFISMRMPEPIMVGGVDKVSLYLAAVNGHDGTMSAHFMTTPIRFRCANMLNVGLEQSTSSFRVRHSSGAPAIMEVRAKAALEHTARYAEEFTKYSEKMVGTALSDAKFEKIIRAEFGAAEGAPTYTKTRCDNKIDTMLRLFTEAETNSEIRGTVWAGFNAIAEWSDHFAHTRRQERLSALAHKAVLDPGVKTTALRLMMKEVK